MPGTSSPRIGKILLDTPSEKPALGFGETAKALAQLIIKSEPRFAVGIFGNWGSGKTTLMEAMKKRLLRKESVVVVEFNAWRFEREPQLLVPLLDTVRAAIVRWSANQDPADGEQVRRIARRIGRVVRVLASGLSGQVGLPGSLSVSYDVGKAIDTLNVGSDQPQSVYVAAFRELSESFGQLRKIGATRVIVFIDDLDRCLPTSALEVLESMKLFFDLEGFVFVVGLDEKVVQRAVRARFRDVSTVGRPSMSEQDGGQDESPSTRELERLENDYLEKIFQVPYHVPPMLADDLDALLLSMYREAKLGPSQRKDFNEKVRPYLDFVAVERQVNPREVKRYLNAYTVQTSVRPELTKEVILALQTLTFRYDWQPMYDAILTDSFLFVDALERYRDGEESAFEDLSPELSVLPADLADYLRSGSVDALHGQSSLDSYLSSLEATRGTPQALIEAYRMLGRLRGVLRRLRVNAVPREEEWRSLMTVTRDVTASLSSPRLEVGPSQFSALKDLLQEINEQADTLRSQLEKPRQQADGADAEIRGMTDTIYELSNRAYRELRSLRRADNVPL